MTVLKISDLFVFVSSYWKNRRGRSEMNNADIKAMQKTCRP